jgi:hypothetical protein
MIYQQALGRNRMAYRQHKIRMASSDLPNEAISTSMAIFVQVLATEDVAKPHGASMMEVYSALAPSNVS